MLIANKNDQKGSSSYFNSSVYMGIISNAKYNSFFIIIFITFYKSPQEDRECRT